MKELMLIMATVMPEEKLIDDLQEAITEYKLTNSNDSRRSLATFCQMFVLRSLTKGDPEKMNEVLKDMKQHDEREKLFTVNPS